MPRLFISAPLPEAVLDAISGLARLDQAGLRWTARDQWHITVRFLGECDVTSASSALGSLSAGAATVRLGPQVTLLGRNVVCIPATGLEALAAAVAGVTSAIGEPNDPRRFRGHVTLARLKARARPVLVGAAFEASFLLDRLDLVESTPTPGGAVHEVRSVKALDRPC